mgnify:CR=1 FL=1
MAVLRLALRNLTRNRKRAAASLAIIAIGAVLIVLAEGFIQWIFWAMREAAIQSQLGHVQVTRPDYFKSGAIEPYAFLLPENAPERAAIESTPGVKLVAPRLNLTGLIAHGETTVSFMAEGVDPAKEESLSVAVRIVKGRNLNGASANEVILGNGLARNLGATPGSTVSLLVTSSRGGINAIEAKVAGIFVSASQAYDDAALRLPLKLAQQLVKKQGAHAWLVLLEETEKTDEFLAAFRTRFPPDRYRLEFTPWHQRADFYNKTVALFTQQMNVLRLIIAAIIVLSISNLLIMNVLERTGEIGTLMAVGLKRRTILRLFALESLVLGLAGAVIGVVAGFLLAHLISAIGIPMPPPPGMEEGYTGAIRATPAVIGTAFLIALVTPILAGLYPARKASGLKIVDALRHNI